MRRMAAVQLWDMKAASVGEIAAGFGVTEDTLWRWHRALDSGGFTALVSTKRGPKGGSKLTEEVITRIHELKATGLANTRIGAQVGVSEFSVRRALTLVPTTETATELDAASVPGVAPSMRESSESVRGTIQEELPLLPAPTDRSTERVAASLGELPELAPVFAPAARVPYTGMFFALPALEATMLQSCAATVFTDLSHRVYGLNSMLLEGVLRTLLGEPRAEGATRLDPVAFGRVLGLDRAPEVKTIRRQHRALVDTGKIPELMSTIAFERFQAHQDRDDSLAAVLYVDGHTRAYEGKKKISRIHSTRVKMAVPATEETWVSASLSSSHRCNAPFSGSCNERDARINSRSFLKERIALKGKIGFRARRRRRLQAP